MSALFKIIIIINTRNEPNNTPLLLKRLTTTLTRLTTTLTANNHLTTAPCIQDKHALPVGDDEYGEVHQLWYMSDRQVHSAKLEGSLEGEERQQWWDEQRQFKIKDEPDDPHDPNAPSTEETVAATEEQTRTQPATAPTPTAEVVAAAEEMDIGKDMDGEAPAGP